MITTFYKLIISLILIAAGFQGLAQTISDSLKMYLEKAEKNNPAVLQKFIEYQAALQKVHQAGSLPDPEISTGVFLQPMEIVNGSQIAEVRLMQMLPWFGVLKNAKNEMNLMANAKYEALIDAKQQLHFEVQRTWYELYKTRKNINIYEKNMAILTAIERLASVKFKASYLSESMPSSSGMNNQIDKDASGSLLADLYRIQLEKNELRNNITLLKSQEVSEIALFNSYLNRPSGHPVYTDSLIVIDSSQFTITEVIHSVKEKNPMLKMFEFENQSYLARKKMVTGMSYPMTGAGVSYSLISKNDMSVSAMNGKDMIMPMISITLPVYRNKYNAMKKEADLMSQAATMNYISAVNSLEVESYQAFQSYQDALRRIQLFEEQYDLANKSLNIMLKNFYTSGTDLTEVLRLYQMTLDYELKKAEAEADLNIAAASLKRLMAIPLSN